MHENDPYQAPNTVLVDPVPLDELVPAERLTRLGAALLDGLLQGLVILPLMFGALFYFGVFSGEPDPKMFDFLQGGGQILLSLGFLVVGFAIFLLLQGYPLSRYGQTWAKRWLGIRIVDEQGHKPEFVRLVLLRYGVVQLAGLVPCLGPLFGLVDPLCIFRDDRRCLHDLMAGTRVVVGSPDAADY